MIINTFNVNLQSAYLIKGQAIKYIMDNENRYTSDENAAIIIDQLREIHKKSIEMKKYKESVSALALISKIKGIDHPENDSNNAPQINISFGKRSNIDLNSNIIDSQAEIIQLPENNS